MHHHTSFIASSVTMPDNGSLSQAEPLQGPQQPSVSTTDEYEEDEDLEKPASFVNDEWCVLFELVTVSHIHDDSLPSHPLAIASSCGALSHA